MTRETKIGLLIATGIILLIGIVISDHLSVVKKQDPANVGNLATDAQKSLAPLPGPEATASTSTLIPSESTNLTTPMPGNAGNSGYPGSPPLPAGGRSPEGTAPAGATTPNTLTFGGDPASAYNTSSVNRNFTPVAPNNAETFAPGNTLTPGTPVGIFDEPALSTTPPLGGTTGTGTGTGITGNGSIITPPQPDSPASAQLVHYVKAKESVWDIAKKYYGDGNKWKAIASANKSSVGSKGEIREGVRLVIPDIKPTSATGTSSATLASTNHEAAGSSNSRTATAGRTITVQAGDTLSKLAHQHLGSANRWNDILKANSDQLKKPEQLQVGMVLRLPGATSAPTSAPTATPTHTTSSTLSPASPTDAASGTYTVQTGDSLYTIARKTLGDANRWREIYNANKKLLGNRPQELKVGDKLIIPKTSAKETTPAPSRDRFTGRNRDVAMTPSVMPTLLDAPTTQPAALPNSGFLPSTGGRG